MAAAPATPNVGALEFLKALWGDTEGWAELTIISKGSVRSYPFQNPQSIPSLVEAVPRHNRSGNAYMGVCLRREKWPRNSGRLDSNKKPIVEFRGTEANALASWAVWLEADFTSQGHKGKTVPEETIRKTLREFAFKPSIILRSGGGIQVYWLLKEAAQGDDLRRVKGINRALANYFEADPQSVDLARILRIPGSLNLKYNPPRPCEISWWHPDLRYVLSDFEDLLPKDVTKVTKVTRAQVVEGQVVEPDESGARETPSTVLPEDAIAEIAVALAEAWPAGFKHQSALHVAGLLAWWGVVEESAKAIVRAASDTVQGDTEGRLKDLEGTYRKFLNGEPVTGKTSFLQMTEDPKYPLKEQAHHFLKTVTRVVLRVRGPRAPKTPPLAKAPEEHTQFDIDSVPINPLLKSIIRDGLPAYVEFEKSTESAAKFAELEADGKMSRTVADCYLVTSLLRDNVEDAVIMSIFRDTKYKIGEKARERPADFQRYVELAISSCKKTVKSQPKWKVTSIARASAGLVDKEFEDQHFTVKRVTKYKQDQPTFDIIVVLEGLESIVRKCSVDQAYNFDAFAKTYFTQFDRFIPFQKQATWERMYQAAEHVTIEIHEDESTLLGQIEETLNELSVAAVGEKNGKIAINHNAVRMDDGDIVFKTKIVIRMLKDRGIDTKRQDVIHTLTSMECPYGTRRLGGYPAKVWTKISSNGRGEARGEEQTPFEPEPPGTPAPAAPGSNGTSHPVPNPAPKETLFDVEAVK